TDIEVDGGYAYVVTERNIRILDVAHPTKPPLQVGVYESEPCGDALCEPQDSIRQIAVKDNYLFSARFQNLDVVDVSDPSQPTLVHTIDNYFYFGAPVHLKIYGNYLYISDHALLYILSIAVPTRPRAVLRFVPGDLYQSTD